MSKLSEKIDAYIETLAPKFEEVRSTIISDNDLIAFNIAVTTLFMQTIASGTPPEIDLESFAHKITSDLYDDNKDQFEGMRLNPAVTEPSN